jgi:broad specificity phosphatase PhoE
MTTRVVLVRHGETPGNRERRFQVYGTPLSPLGRLQAARVAARLAAGPVPDVLYTSDLARAAETAAVIGERLGLRPTVAPELRELDVGDWKGQPHPAMAAAFPGGYEGWIAAGGMPRLHGPEGESLDDLVARAIPWLEAALRRHGGQRLLVVSHGLTLGTLLAHAHGWDQRDAFRTRRVRLFNTAVSEVEAGADGALRCTLVGCVAHLDAATMGSGSGIGSA